MSYSSEPSIVIKNGRTVGILLLLQLACALMLPFIMAHPVNAGFPAFLTEVAEHDSKMRASVFISFVGSALTVALGINMYRILESYSKPFAILFLIVCSISCVLDLVHAATVMSMMSLSNSFVSSGVTDTAAYEIVAKTVSSARRSAHIIQLIGIGAWMFVFYLSLFRFRLVHRLLAGVGMLCVISQFTGVTLMMLLGKNAVGEMAMPLLPVQIMVSFVLIFQGWRMGITDNSK